MKAVHIAGTAGLLGVLLIGAAVSFRSLPVARTTEAPSPSLTPLLAGQYIVAAPGRVEPSSEEIRVGASVTGVLKELLAKEGDRVKRGDVLARLESDDYAASLNKAEAELKLQQAELLRVTNGARAVERRQAWAVVQEMSAVENNAKIEFERQRILSLSSIASRAALDQAQTQATVAHQKYQEALEKYNLINDAARDEDVTIAQARVDAALAAREEAQAALTKTEIRSPIDGTVLRTFRHPGELLSIFTNDPILSVGDVSQLNVRADVDEADVARLEPDMPAYVTAEAYGDRHFPGRIVRIGQMLGKKNIVTGEARERTDTKVLEVVIALDMPNPLRPGLRVNAFLTRPEQSAAQVPAGGK